MTALGPLASDRPHFDRKETHIVTNLRRVGVAFAALALSVLAVSPALATDLFQDTPITEAQAPAGTADECAGFTTAGSTLWHFVLIGGPTDDTTVITLTAEFTNADTQTATGTEADHSGTWQFNIIIPSGDTLLSASTDVDGTQLNLSHVCVGPPTEVPEAPFALLLPLIALAAFGGYLLKNRRSTFGA
jgi:hypothetical protein